MNIYLKYKEGRNMKKRFLIAGFVLSSVMTGNAVLAGEKEGGKISLPGASMEVTTEYSGSKKEYSDAVKKKEQSLKTEGGKGMFNEASQPTKETAVRAEVGGTVFGSGGSVTSEKSIGGTSAAEDALRNHEKKGR